MKTMRDRIFSLGAAGVLALGVVWAQDLAPQEPGQAPQAPVRAQPAGGGLLPARPTTVTRPATGVTAARTPPAAGASVTVPAEGGPVVSRATGAAAGEKKEKTTTTALKFDKAESDFLLQAFAEETGKTLLVAPDVPKATGITLRSQPGVALTRDEYLEAIEVTLSMNGIVLEPFGEKFLKVLARKTLRTEGVKILMETPEGGHPEKSQVISQMIQLKAITISEAQKALEGFKKPEGLIQAFERTNSLLVTDTQENINRMLEIVRFIDQPLVATEEVNVRRILYAKADDIKKRLEELVAESQKQSQAKEEVKANTSGAPGFTRATTSPVTTAARPLPPGLTRIGSTATPQPAAAAPNESLETLVSDADRGMIRGKVQIISDERSNQLIIITRNENMNFFDKIITVLDVETLPDVMVEVQRLKYADAEEVSTMLNDLIGNVSSKKDDKAPAGAAKAAAPAAAGEPAKSTTLAEAVAARTGRTEASAGDTGGKSKLGQLSKDNIKILADKRTNALVMMGSPSDLKAVKEIINGMDIQLSQVLIETVVLQVELGNDVKTGIDWVIGKQSEGYMFRNGDQMSGGGGTGTDRLKSLVSGVTSNAISSGINYFLKSDKLNVSALVTAAKSDNRTKVLSSPILLTVDNKEATIEATSMRYLYKGVRYSGSTQYGTEVPDYEQRDIGLTVKVTPRINPNGTVVLSIDETFETIGANQTVGTDSYPTINTRKLQADVSVDNMQTVVLGGLVQSESKNEESGIPILKDIPWIGKYLFGSTAAVESRSELLVFLTPYVLETPEQAETEARRRKESMSDERPWSDGGWSKSGLSDPLSQKDHLERERRSIRREDDEREALKMRERLQRERDEKRRQQAEEDAREVLERVKRQSSDKLAEPVPQTGTGTDFGAMRVSETTEVVKPAEEATPAALLPPAAGKTP